MLDASCSVIAQVSQYFNKGGNAKYFENVRLIKKEALILT